MPNFHHSTKTNPNALPLGQPQGTVNMGFARKLVRMGSARKHGTDEI